MLLLLQAPILQYLATFSSIISQSLNLSQHTPTANRAIHAPKMSLNTVAIPGLSIGIEAELLLQAISLEEDRIIQDLKTFAAPYNPDISERD